jgi:starvation-inducible DNA-binding protein
MIDKQLKNLFADNFAVYTKAHGYHFNVVGPDFFEYHKLFQQVYDYLYEQHDVLGELQRQLGIQVSADLRSICEATVMDCEFPTNMQASKMIDDLYKDIETLITSAEALYKSANNGAVETVIGDYSVGLNKLCWFLRSSK